MISVRHVPLLLLILLCTCFVMFFSDIYEHRTPQESGEVDGYNSQPHRKLQANTQGRRGMKIKRRTVMQEASDLQSGSEVRHSPLTSDATNGRQITIQGTMPEAHPQRDWKTHTSAANYDRKDSKSQEVQATWRNPSVTSTPFHRRVERENNKHTLQQNPWDRMNSAYTKQSANGDRVIGISTLASQKAEDPLRSSKHTMAATLGTTSPLDSLSETESIASIGVSTTYHISRPPRDKFSCPPCTCSFTHSSYVIANCTNSTLSDIPAELPKHTMRLSMFQTSMLTFNTARILIYSNLSALNITSNSKLQRIRNEEEIYQKSDISELDLSSNSIWSIQDGSFQMMSKLKNLSLSQNKLQNITKLTFVGLENLKMLNLSLNDLYYIELGSLEHMKHLLALDLSRNRRLGYSKKRLSPLLFKSSHLLQQLYIQGNSNGGDVYPMAVLQQLDKLRKLKIDGLNCLVLGPMMSKLKNFVHLEMGSPTGYCWLQNISQSFFENLPHLETLYLFRCPLLYVDPQTYLGAKNLKRLTLSMLKNYDLFTALEDLVSLQNSSLKFLSLISLTHTAHCRFLGAKHSKYLKHLKLEELDLSRNEINYMGADFMADLPRTLMKLILRENRLIFSGNLVFRLGSLFNLQELDVSEQNFLGYSNVFTDELPSERIAFSSNLPGIRYNHNIAVPLSRNDYAVENACRNDETGTTAALSSCKIQYDDTFHKRSRDCDCVQLTRGDTRTSLTKDQSVGNFTLPPNLRIVRAANYANFASYLLTKRLNNNNSLRVFDFSGNLLSSLCTLHENMMPRVITTASLESNYIKQLRGTFFKNGSSLKHLSLKDNILGDEFANDGKGSIFARLDKTQYLDISVNMIYSLPREFFKGLTSLHTLIMSDNKLQVLNASFSQMKSLNFLDLSRNSISWITKESRDDLDFIAASSQIKLLVDLTRNPLPCTCAGLEILYWMAMTKVYFLYEDYLYCHHGNGHIVPIGNIKERVQSLQRYCASKATIIVICVASILSAGMLVVLAMLYRYRWKLRYLRSIAIAKLVGFKPQEAQTAGYKFDAYFIYTEQSRRFVLRQCRQELEENRGHRICLDERDFMPGTYSLSNIVSAIQNSNKTVAVVTPDFYEGEYSEYGIKMALMEEIYTRRSVLYLCVYQPMADDDIAQCHDLLTVMNRNHYTEYPPENEAVEEIRQNFWDQLSRAIGHTGNDIIQPSLGPF